MVGTADAFKKLLSLCHKICGFVNLNFCESLKKKSGNWGQKMPKRQNFGQKKEGV
jgi:hypothetical protein